MEKPGEPDKKENSMLLPEERITRLEEENAVLRIAHAELIIQIEELSKNAFYDKLTGLKSRAFFEEEMKDIFGSIFQRPHSPERRQQSSEESENICLIIFDLDKFKNVNDTLGHLAGDEVLKTTAKVIEDSVRDSDVAVRWGGEELAVVLMGASIEEAVAKADTIRQKVSEIKFEQYPDLAVTISAGVASVGDFEDQTSLFNATDQALYQSKHSGRNKVTAYSKT